MSRPVYVNRRPGCYRCCAGWIVERKGGILVRRRCICASEPSKSERPIIGKNLAAGRDW